MSVQKQIRRRTLCSHQQPQIVGSVDKCQLPIIQLLNVKCPFRSRRRIRQHIPRCHFAVSIPQLHEDELCRKLTDSYRHQFEPHLPGRQEAYPVRRPMI